MSASMLERMQMGLRLKFEKKRDELARLKQRVDDLQDIETSSMMKGISSRMEIAVNMENLDDKIKAGDQIKVETNIMMQKFEIALLKRYQDTH